MEQIQMVDLKSQYYKIKDEINTAINSVIESNQFIKGPIVKEFEKNLAKYLNIKHVVSCGNGTDALQIAMMALGLKPGDEVITADFTFIATVEVIALLGLTPVLVDVERDTFNMNIEALRKAITPKTKAIVPVHLFGQCTNMEEILEIAKANDLYVIEDTAQAIGADYTFKNGISKKAGTMGTIGCTSFFPSKNLGAYGDGGALFTKDDEIAEKLRSIVNHGMKVRYYHDYIGVNSRLDSIQAAILNVKLKYLDQYKANRQAAAKYYNDSFSKLNNIEIPVVSSFTNHVFHQYTLKLKDINREKIQDYLKRKGIPSMVYYPVPLHKQKAFHNYSFKDDNYPVTNELSDIVLSLPIHTEMSEEQLEYIVKCVKEFIS
ncbi:MAG: DegT/DnrJ/EryC1/StrS family aminotransferase [Chlorobi bacterium]|nr:DegT/DnrJ/EryC1/StrS family aminotransferase [Chlorobiota bacterium]